MAPHAGFDTDQVKDKARKDILYLLEGVSKDYLAHLHAHAQGKPGKAPANLPLNRFEGRRIW